MRCHVHFRAYCQFSSQAIAHLVHALLATWHITTTSSVQWYRVTSWSLVRWTKATLIPPWTSNCWLTLWNPINQLLTSLCHLQSSYEARLWLSSSFSTQKRPLAATKSVRLNHLQMLTCNPVAEACFEMKTSTTIHLYDHLLEPLPLIFKRNSRCQSQFNTTGCINESCKISRNGAVSSSNQISSPELSHAYKPASPKLKRYRPRSKVDPNAKSIRYTEI